MNSFLIAALGVIDIYYVNQDIALLARLAGWTDKTPPPPNNHYLAGLAICCVGVLWAANARFLQKRTPTFG